ncbi:hypothetical protein BT08C7_48360 [Escherichia coli]
MIYKIKEISVINNFYLIKSSQAIGNMLIKSINDERTSPLFE